MTRKTKTKKEVATVETTSSSVYEKIFIERLYAESMNNVLMASALLPKNMLSTERSVAIKEQAEKLMNALSDYLVAAKTPHTMDPIIILSACMQTYVQQLGLTINEAEKIMKANPKMSDVEVIHELNKAVGSKAVIQTETKKSPVEEHQKAYA